MQIHNDIKIEVYELYPESRLCRLQPIGSHLHGSKVRSIYFAATTVKVSMPSASLSIFGTSAQCAWAFLHHLHSYLSELIHRSKTARGDTVVQHDLCSCLQRIKKKTLSFYISFIFLLTQRKGKNTNRKWVTSETRATRLMFMQEHLMHWIGPQMTI